MNTKKNHANMLVMILLLSASYGMVRMMHANLLVTIVHKKGKVLLMRRTTTRSSRRRKNIVEGSSLEAVKKLIEI